MRATLSALPNVRFLADLPAASDAQSAGLVRPVPAQSAIPLLKDIIERAFPPREGRLAFTDQCLADSDAALSHAWALKRLVDRYSEAEEQLLNPASDQKLLEMLRAHLAGIEPVRTTVCRLFSIYCQAPAPWLRRYLRTGGRAFSLCFSAVQQQDRLVSEPGGRLSNGWAESRNGVRESSGSAENHPRAARWSQGTERRPY